MDLVTARGVAGAWAELEEVWARDGLISLAGMIHGAEPEEGPWRLRLAPAGGPVPRSPRSWLGEAARRARIRDGWGPGPYEVTMSDRWFEAAVPVGDLVLPRPVRSLRWDAYLVADGSASLRLGRHLGVPRRACAITYPAQTVKAYGRRFRVRPSYTEDNHFAIGSRRAQ